MPHLHLHEERLMNKHKTKSILVIVSSLEHCPEVTHLDTNSHGIGRAVYGTILTYKIAESTKVAKLNNYYTNKRRYQVEFSRIYLI